MVDGRSARCRRSSLKGLSGLGQVCVRRGERRRAGDGNEGANCFQWILKSNPNPPPRAQAGLCTNGILMTVVKIRENDPGCMIDVKATDLCRTCLNRQYVPPGFYGSVYTYSGFNIAEVHKYYIISFYSLYYSWQEHCIDSPHSSSATL